MQKRQSLRDYTAEEQLFKRRAFYALLFIFALTLGLLSNLYQLQVVEHNAYQTRSDGNRIKVVPVAPNRGLIYDRNGIIIAENIPIFNLEIHLEQVENFEQTVSEITQLLAVTENELERFKDNLASTRRTQPVTLLRNINEGRVAKFAVHQHRFPGVSVAARLTRHYPYNDTLTHVLGYIAKINARDQSLIAEWEAESNYAATQFIGKQGIERYYEQLLHGSVGFKHVEVDNKGREIRVLSVNPPVPGKDLILNIDVKLQEFVQSIMRDKRGSVVVSDPNTGAVLAMYSNPSYDPNSFVNGISRRDFNNLLNNRARPLLNRAVQGQYPPASLIKPHLALLGLEYGVITEQTVIDDPGEYQIPDVEHVWRDWLRRGHGKVDVKRSVEVSCDTFYYDLAYKLGIDTIHDYMSKFGFGQYTGIDLIEETDANMPSRGWKRARYNEPWYKGDTISVGIGQGYWTATPIQLVDSLNTLINYGVRFPPTLLKSINTDEQEIPHITPEANNITPLNAYHWNIIKESMVNTVNLPHGTAFQAYTNTPYTSAGKTGTAQLFTVGQDENVDDLVIAEYLKDNAMYFGYAPYDEPVMTVMVALENAGGGGSNAAPVARQVMDYYLIDRNIGGDFAQR